jgi:SAM-dependent methyltransferase
MDHVIEIRLLKRIYDHLPALLVNTTSSLQVALQDNLLTEVYKSGIVLTAAYPQFVRILDLLAHKKPRMKILEIGAGTGGATRYAMDILGGNTNSKRYMDYTFTDITTSFLSPAEAEFSNCKGMVYKKLDIGVDPSTQGFEPIYDLAIAFQCLHATAKMAETIRNTRRLLKPGGNVLILESTQALNFVGLVFGTFPDYWNGAQDGRIDNPFLNKEQWKEVLLGNGFSGIDIVLDDLPEPVFHVSTILATAVEPVISPQAIEPSPQPRIFIVYLGDLPLFANTIAAALQEVGTECVCVPLSDARLLENQRVISLAGLDHSPFSSSEQSEFEGAKDLISRAATLVWVSAGGLIKASRPNAALTLGLMTAVAIERPSIRFAILDLEPTFDHSATDIAQALILKEQSIYLDSPAGSRDTQFIMDNGCLHISRMIPDHNLNHQFKLQEGLSKGTEMQALASQGPIRIDFEQPGVLDSLYFKADEEYLKPLPADFVEVRTMAMGLNVRVSGLPIQDTLWYLTLYVPGHCCRDWQI